MRYLVDEAALSQLADSNALGPCLSTFASTVLDLLRAGEPVGTTAGWAAIAVGGVDLGEFLSNLGPAHRDAALLAMRALDRCTVWDDDPDLDMEPCVTVDGAAWESFGVAYAASLTSAGTVAGCITVLGCHPAGPRTVVGNGEPVQVAFLLETGDSRHVHRLRFATEHVAEDDFFAVAERAFPDLVFADGVTFQRFDGRYRDLRDRVVAHLTALDDRFLQAYEAASGDLRTVSTELGITMSIEGNTRSSPRLMRQRDAQYQGRTYRCEIHSKIEPHRNRIHFHPGDEGSGGRIVIGMFVKHLQT